MWFALIRKDFIDKITIAVCVALILTAFSGAFLPDKISESENRTLAQMPKIVMNKSELRKFPILFEVFVNDNFGCRSLLLKINHTILTLFKRPTSKRVLYGKDGFLFYADENSLQDIAGDSYLTSEEKTRWESSLLAKYEWLKEKGIKYRFVVVPDKHSIYSEMLSFKNKTSRLDDLLNTINPITKEFLLDLRPALLKYKNETDRLLYFKKDTHWNNYGAYIGFSEIMKSLRNGAERGLCVEENEKLKDPSNLLLMLTNTKKLQTQLEPNKLKFRFKKETRVSELRILDKYQKQLLNVLADFPMSSGAFQTISSHGIGTALVLHDSCTVAMQPFLSSIFARVIYVWCRPDDELFAYLVDQEKPDVVIEERVECYMQFVPRISFIKNNHK